jgi:hypothetical protein
MVTRGPRRVQLNFRCETWPGTAKANSVHQMRKFHHPGRRTTEKDFLFVEKKQG